MLAALGSWSGRRRRWVMTAWAFIFVLGIAIGSQVFGQLKDSTGGSGSESIKGFHLMDHADPHGPGVIALINGRSPTPLPRPPSSPRRRRLSVYPTSPA